MKRLGKDVPAVKDPHEIIEVTLESGFSTRSVRRGYITRAPAWELTCHLIVCEEKTKLEQEHSVGAQKLKILHCQSRYQETSSNKLRTLVCNNDS
jgi:hypothetical protein